jgi:hypothetical protein
MAAPLPDGTNADEAQAQFNNGVLEVSVPVPERKHRQIEIQSGTQAQAAGSAQRSINLQWPQTMMNYCSKGVAHFMDKQQIEEMVKYLSNCPGGQFSEIMRRVLAARPENFLTKEYEAKLVLAWATRFISETANSSDTPCRLNIQLIGYQAPDHYGEESLKLEKLIEQGGICDNCQIGVYSHVCRARCPVCQSLVLCT